VADFYSILAQAVGALDPSTADTRGQLYDRARSAMTAKLEAAAPPFPGADVAAAKIAFESAVARVEAEAMEREAATAATVGAPSLSPDTEGMRADPRTASLRAPARETWLTDLLERAAHGGDDARSYAPKRARDGAR
jgi:hypothetical protein